MSIAPTAEHLEYDQELQSDGLYEDAQEDVQRASTPRSLDGCDENLDPVIGGHVDSEMAERMERWRDEMQSTLEDEPGNAREELRQENEMETEQADPKSASQDGTAGIAGATSIVAPETQLQDVKCTGSDASEASEAGAGGDRDGGGHGHMLEGNKLDPEETIYYPRSSCAPSAEDADEGLKSSVVLSKMPSAGSQITGNDVFYESGMNEGIPHDQGNGSLRAATRQNSLGGSQGASRDHTIAQAQGIKTTNGSQASDSPSWYSGNFRRDAQIFKGMSRDERSHSDAESVKPPSFERVRSEYNTEEQYYARPPSPHAYDPVYHNPKSKKHLYVYLVPWTTIDFIGIFTVLGSLYQLNLNDGEYCFRKCMELKSELIRLEFALRSVGSSGPGIQATSSVKTEADLISTGDGYSPAPAPDELKQRIQNLMTEWVESAIDSLIIAIGNFHEKGIPSISSAQQNKSSRYLNMTSIATFLSAVTASMLQISVDDVTTPHRVGGEQSPCNVVEAIVPVGVVREPDNTLPAWLSAWLNTGPMISLLISGAFFSVAICLFSFSSSQKLVTSLVTLAFSGFHSVGLLFLSLWFILEKWKFRTNAGRLGHELTGDSLMLSLIDWLIHVLQSLRHKRHPHRGQNSEFGAFKISQAEMGHGAGMRPQSEKADAQAASEDDDEGSTREEGTWNALSDEKFLMNTTYIYGPYSLEPPALASISARDSSSRRTYSANHSSPQFTLHSAPMMAHSSPSDSAVPVEAPTAAPDYSRTSSPLSVQISSERRSDTDSALLREADELRERLQLLESRIMEHRGASPIYIRRMSFENSPPRRSRSRSRYYERQPGRRHHVPESRPDAPAASIVHSPARLSRSRSRYYERRQQRRRHRRSESRPDLYGYAEQTYGTHQPIIIQQPPAQQTAYGYTPVVPYYNQNYAQAPVLPQVPSSNVQTAASFLPQSRSARRPPSPTVIVVQPGSSIASSSIRPPLLAPTYIGTPRSAGERRQSSAYTPPRFSSPPSPPPLPTPPRPLSPPSPPRLTDSPLSLSPPSLPSPTTASTTSVSSGQNREQSQLRIRVSN
ncbi:hypothetical protein EW145_g1325 [Phellinidium pouzarii]|uniref:Uncharacterized protein n=1 Tax=Phellinidium pouzarii TaxID=167371 RepID=A0A4S4LGR3_9AGAM|nr:hypothetical protein EW145_g1325 [Phellinidium pouzarii]